MSRDPKLAPAARDFAVKLKALLNRTVCVGAHVSSIIPPDGRAVVGTKLDRSGLDSHPVPLRNLSPSARCWLSVSYRLYLDSRGYLTCDSSTYSVYAGRDAEYELFHYDYERDKDAYTEAHLQVIGESGALREIMSALDKPKRTLRHLHFPVGGRRFRPSLEDVLECLINEGLVAPIEGWEDVLDRSRHEFRDRQLKAAVMRNPDIAAAALKDCGYEVKLIRPERENVVKLAPWRRRR